MQCLKRVQNPKTILLGFQLFAVSWSIKNDLDLGASPSIHVNIS